MSVICENPTFIINPSLPELLSKYGNYFFRGQWCQCTRRMAILYRFDKSKFVEYKKCINNDNVNDNFVVADDGTQFPIYMQVPCGHCELCKERKINSFVLRLKYESFCYHHKPLFFTLTYDNQHLPDNGVSVRDCQLFLKRLRVNLERAGYTDKIRYCIVSEYGRRYHRAHYHGILFGIAADDEYNLNCIKRILDRSWGNGFTLLRHVEPTDSNGYFYTSKYMRKDCQVPAGCNQPFCHSSVRGGGLGSKFIQNEKYKHKHIKPDFNILNPWTNRVEPFQWTSYNLSKIAPSDSQYFPLPLRKALRSYLQCYHTIAQNEPHLLWLFETKYKKYRQKYSNIFNAPWDYFPEVPFHCNSANIFEHERIIDKYDSKDFTGFFENHNLRDFILSNLQFDEIKDTDLILKVCKIKRKKNHLKNYEVF